MFVRRLMLVTMALAQSAIAADRDGEGAPVEIPGGRYLMGTAASDIASLRDRYAVFRPGVFENETPPRQVTVDAFRIDPFEVTNARFSEFVRSNPDWLPSGSQRDRNADYLSLWERDAPPPSRAEHPVVFITWAAAQSFCEWAGGRLPSEAEWEYVARSGDDREFPWGNDPPTPELANYSASGIDDTTAVGSYPPNDFGVHDLAGNVWEFLLDEWDDQPPAAEPAIPGDPRAVSGRRSVRGASHGGSIVNLRTRWRDSHVVDNTVAFVGFRCAYPSAIAPQ